MASINLFVLCVRPSHIHDSINNVKSVGTIELLVKFYLSRMHCVVNDSTGGPQRHLAVVMSGFVIYGAYQIIRDTKRPDFARHFSSHAFVFHGHPWVYHC